MAVKIIQGHSHILDDSYINVVIDVIRAFTVAHYAFIHGAKGIYLAQTVEDAFRIKQSNPEFLLAGEIQGLPIAGFDLDNSPAGLNKCDLAGKYLIQKTTNGVRATINSLNAHHIFVTGFSNAKTTAEYIKKRLMNDSAQRCINIIASHPAGDDDLACAQYIESMLMDSMPVAADHIAQRIKHSQAAEKFFDEAKPEFNKEDILICIKEQPSEFVMKVNYEDRIPMIERVNM